MVFRQTRKKGSGLDLFYIVIGFFLLAVIGIMISSVVTKLNTEVQSMSTDTIPSEAKTASTKLAGTMPATLNGGLLFLFFAACLVALILASLTAFNPIFFIFFLLELVLLIVFSAGIANSFQTFIETTALETEHSQYGTIIFLFRYLPFIIGIVGFMLAAVMYKVRNNAI